MHVADKQYSTAQNVKVLERSLLYGIRTTHNVPVVLLHPGSINKHSTADHSTTQHTTLHARTAD
jgi:hypothetical protein